MTEEQKKLKDLYYSRGYAAGKKRGIEIGKKRQAGDSIELTKSIAFKTALKTYLSTDDELPLTESDFERLSQHVAMALTIAESMQ